MEIKKARLVDIKPYFNNPRDNARAVTPTAESIKRYGFLKPIICDMEGVIIAGHTRYLAAYKLGIAEVPVVYLDIDSEKAKEFRIVDNKIAERSSFDEDKLIEELRSMDVPESMQAFFFEDISDMLNFDASFADRLPSISSGSSYGDDDEDYNDGAQQNEQRAESPSAEGYEHHESSNDFDENEDNGESDDDDDEEFNGEVKTPNDLYRIYTRDGRQYMKVICPYCGEIEEAEFV